MHKIVKFQMDERSIITSYDLYIFYLKNSRVLGLLWLVLTICFTIILIVVFLAPNWISQGIDSSNSGYFGLFSFCVYNRFSASYRCTGTWTDFSTLPADLPALKTACFLVLFACILSLLTLFFAMLGVFIKLERIFHLCAWIQLFCFVSLFVGVCVYPISWDSKLIRPVCGERTNQFELDTCIIRWPYVIACMLTGLILLTCLLAVLLAARQAQLITDYAGAYQAYKNGKCRQSVNCIDRFTSSTAI